MSTKNTLRYSEDFHLYQEGFDNENVYLKVKNGPYVEDLTPKIPLMAWKEMRRHTLEPEERYSNMSDAELEQEAARAVDEHRSELEREPRSQLRGLFGIAIFGSPDSSRADMIRSFLSFYGRTAMPADAEEATP